MIVENSTQQAINALMKDERFMRFMKILEAELSQQDHTNRRSRDVDLYRGQGRSLMLEEILDLVSGP